MSSDIIIDQNHLKAFGINFFRANAPSLTLGVAGDIEKPVFGANYVTNEDLVPAAKLKIHRAFTLSIGSLSVSEKDVGVSIAVPKLGTISAGSASQQLREETLKLVQLEVLPKELVNAANESPGVLNTLKRIGNDGRLVHKIIVAMDAKTATTVTGASSLDVSASVGGIALTPSASTGGTTTTTVDLATCTFAYLLLKLKWDANMKSNWKKIEDWEEDQWGLA